MSIVNRHNKISFIRQGHRRQLVVLRPSSKFFFHKEYLLSPELVQTSLWRSSEAQTTICQSWNLTEATNKYHTITEATNVFRVPNTRGSTNNRIWPVATQIDATGTIYLLNASRPFRYSMATVFISVFSTQFSRRMLFSGSLHRSDYHNSCGRRIHCCHRPASKATQMFWTQMRLAQNLL
jgi:hypothetical protein